MCRGLITGGLALLLGTGGLSQSADARPTTDELRKARSVARCVKFFSVGGEHDIGCRNALSKVI